MTIALSEETTIVSDAGYFVSICLFGMCERLFCGSAGEKAGPPSKGCCQRSRITARHQYSPNSIIVPLFAPAFSALGVWCVILYLVRSIYLFTQVLL